MFTRCRPHVLAGTLALAIGLVVAFPSLAFADSGWATWYGPGFQGNTMSDGQPYNMYDPTTTASNIFPFGTWLKVINPANGRSVVVQVRDRGAFSQALDLSFAAFKLLANPADMWVQITYQVVSGPDGNPIATRPAPSSRGNRPAPATQYTVQSGDTLGSIAAQVGLTTDQLTAWNGLSDPNAITIGQTLRLTSPPQTAPAPATPAAAPATQSYVAQNGDSLSSISQKFGISLDQLAAANGLNDPNTLAIGQTLRIPGSGSGAGRTSVTAAKTKSYTIQPGDTLFGIAQNSGISVDSLISMNQITNPNLVQPGNTIQIPSR